MGACLEWASGLSLAAEHKLQFHKLTSGDKKFGSSTIHVVCGLSQPSYVRGLNHKNVAVSRHLDLPILVVLCPRHRDRGATGAMLLADGKRPLRYTNDSSEQRST